MAERLQICCLGRFSLERAGVSITSFASRKAEALFIYLACNSRPHPREALAALFWPDNDQTRALANLSVVLTSLRKQLDAYLVAERHTVAFQHNAPFVLDVGQFEQALAEATAQRQERGLLSRTGAAQLQTAVALYKGDFLAGFNIRNAPEFEAWVRLEQERLRQLMLNALADLVDYHQQRGQLSEAIHHAQQMLALDPLQEETHRQLMLLFALDSQRSAALIQYEQCVAILAEELGIEPDEETAGLYEEIKEEKVIGGNGAKVNALTQSSLHLVSRSPEHNLPMATTTFIGREVELAHIEKWLTEPNGRLLTIIGPGGMGKTRLAQEAARTQLGQFVDGVWYVSLAPLLNDAELVTAVAETIGLAFTGSIDPAHQLVSYFTSKEMLLILDNFEHLVSEKSVVLLGQIVQQAAELKLLVTSRERLNLQAEWLLELGGLPFPADDNPLSPSREPNKDDRPPITDYPAVQLFANRVAQLRSDFVLAGQETAVRKLCQLVGGLPLALELAATWSLTLTVAEIVTEIERGIDFLATNMRDVPARHRSVRAVFAYSWQQLTATEQDVFSRLSVCRGGFTREAAQAIAGASLATLSSLAAKSFIRLDAAEDKKVARYSRHPLLIQFATDQLAQHPDKLAESQERLARYMAQALARRAKQFYGPKRQVAMAFMLAEHENIHTAWLWATEHEPTLLEQMSTSYQYYLIGAGLFTEGATQFRLAVDALAPLEDGLLQAWLQSKLCMFARLVGQTEVGRQLVLDSLAILDRLPTTDKSTQIEAEALKQYGSLLLSDDSNYVEAKKVHKQALALFQQLDDTVGQGDMLFTLSTNAYYTGQYREAIQMAEQGQALQQRARNHIGQMMAQQILGLVHTSLGNFSQAIGLFHNCIDLAKAANYQVDLPWHQADLGYAYLLSGQFEAANAALKRSLQYSLEQGDPQAISVAYTLSGFVCLHNGRFAEAQINGQQGLSYTHKLGLQFPFQHALALNLLGSTALIEDKTKQAFDQLAQSIDLFHEINHLEYLGWSLPVQLIAACSLKRWRRAEHLAAETAELVQGLGAVMPKLMALLALAVWCCQQNRPDIGLTLWTQAEQSALVKQSHWFQILFERLVQPEVSLLGAEQRMQAQAQEQGETLDFAQILEQIRPLLP